MVLLPNVVIDVFCLISFHCGCNCLLVLYSFGFGAATDTEVSRLEKKSKYMHTFLKRVVQSGRAVLKNLQKDV